MKIGKQSFTVIPEELQQDKLYTVIIPKVLYLTDLFAVKKEEILEKIGATHIISVLKLNKPLYDESKYKQMIIPVNDQQQENLLKYFSSVCEFIEEARKNENNRVVVHCWSGISRSVTVIMSYLIYKYKLSYEKVFSIMKEIKRDVHPNDSFVLQLKTWEKKNNQEEKSKDNQTEDLLSQKNNIGFCKKCRFQIFTEDHIYKHSTSEDKKKGFYITKVKKDYEKGTFKQGCTSVFFYEKMDWMGDLETEDGVLFCPKCKSKIGTFKWKGSQCSCGRWVVPAFQVNKSKVDYLESE